MIRRLLAAAAITVAAIGVAPTASADPLADLLGMLPEGYGPQGCHPVDSGRPNALAAVDCDNRVFPGGGPAPGRYILYGDPNTLESEFAAGVAELTPLPCPGRVGIAPSRWGPPDATTGSIACGTGGKPAFVAWTDDSGPYYGLIAGRDLGELMGWWVATIEHPTR